MKVVHYPPIVNFSSLYVLFIRHIIVAIPIDNCHTKFSRISLRKFTLNESSSACFPNFFNEVDLVFSTLAWKITINEIYDMEEERETVEEISSKTWNVMENNLRKEGFREGAAAGKKYVFQSSFDAGYREGFKVGYAKGFLRGFLSILKDEDNRAINLPYRKIDLSTSPCILCEEDIYQKLETNSIKEIISFLIENDKLSVTALKKENAEICRILEFYSHCNK